jgi:hypothetical protein
MPKAKVIGKTKATQTPAVKKAAPVKESPGERLRRLREGKAAAKARRK